jgi:hypothetical protein
MGIVVAASTRNIGDTTMPEFFQCPWDAPAMMANKWSWSDEDGECFHGQYWGTEAEARAAYAETQKMEAGQ